MSGHLQEHGDGMINMDPCRNWRLDMLSYMQHVANSLIQSRRQSCYRHMHASCSGGEAVQDLLDVGMDFSM